MGCTGSKGDVKTIKSLESATFVEGNDGNNNMESRKKNQVNEVIAEGGDADGAEAESSTSSEEESESEVSSQSEDQEGGGGGEEKPSGPPELALITCPKPGFVPVEGIPTDLQDDFPDYPYDLAAMVLGSTESQPVSGMGTYTGAWENGQMCGIGRIEDGGGNKFTGQFKDGRLQGLVFAEMVGSRGVTRYWGEYFQQKPHGFGRMQLPDGSVIIGNFNQGKRQGRCKEVRSNGAVVISVFNGDEIDGMGLFKHNNGELYIGAFKKSQYHGQGTFWWPDGRVYMGTFEAGAQAHKGTQWWPDGQVFKGDFKANQPNGSGVLHLAQGNVEITGLFVKGCVEGTCHVHTLNPDGNWYSRDAKYVLGKRQRWLGTDKPIDHQPLTDPKPPRPQI